MVRKGGRLDEAAGVRNGAKREEEGGNVGEYSTAAVAFDVR